MSLISSGRACLQNVYVHAILPKVPRDSALLYTVLHTAPSSNSATQCHEVIGHEHSHVVASPAHTTSWNKKALKREEDKQSQPAQ